MKIYLANQMLHSWGRDIVDHELDKMGYPKMSTEARAISGPGGFEYLPDPTQAQQAIGNFMASTVSKIEWQVASMIWGPVKTNHKEISEAVDWTVSEVKKFQERLLQNVAMTLI